MTGKSPNTKRLKAAVSVSEMARMVGMSRARFYDLVRRGVFCQPVYSITNRRPLYTADQQEQNLTARETSIGVNGEYVLFYERRAQPEQPSKQPKPKVDHSGLIQSLKELGIDPKPAQVRAAVEACFPNGTADVDDQTLLRTAFRHLKRQGGA